MKGAGRGRGMGHGGGAALVLALCVIARSVCAADPGEPTLAEEAAFRAAVDRVAAAVVRIEPTASAAAAGGGEVAVGSGPSTGLVVAATADAAWILTTAFAVPGDVAEAVVVRADGGRQAARVAGRDESRGLVLLQTQAIADLPALEPAPRRELAPGQWSIAVGRGWDQAAPSVAVGIVSAVDRAWGRAVQTDASVSPANYGGPLVDIAGRVIGILTPLPADTAGMKRIAGGAFVMGSTRAEVDAVRAYEDELPSRAVTVRVTSVWIGNNSPVSLATGRGPRWRP